jgi:hypothetical protein
MQLLRRVITDFPDDLLQVASAHYTLGQALARRGDLTEAVEHFRACRAIRRGMAHQGEVDLALAETLTALRETSTSGGDSDAEALLLLDEAAASVAFLSQHWRIGVTRSRLLNRRGDHPAAAMEVLSDTGTSGTPTTVAAPPDGWTD